MDYYFVDPDNQYNVSNKNGQISFNFSPKDVCNFFEASLTLKLDYVINKKPGATEIPANTPIQSLKKFFIYGIFRDAELFISNKKFAKQERVFNYVRANYLFTNDPRDELYGMKDIQLKHHYDEGKLVFNIPLRFLFSEFKGHNFVDSKQKEFKFYFQPNEAHVFTSLNESLDFDYKVTSVKLKVPKFLSNNELTTPLHKTIWKNESYECKIKHIVDMTRGDINCFSGCERPMNLICFFLDANKNITNDIQSVKLMLNNEIIPQVDMDAETDMDHYYELYLRYVDYTYGEISTEKHEKVMTVLSFSEYKQNPIFYFILPKIKEDGHYNIKLKLKFNSLNRKTEELFAVFNHSTEWN